jgi:hypothetical protein
MGGFGLSRRQELQTKDCIDNVVARLDRLGKVIDKRKLKVFELFG